MHKHLIQRPTQPQDADAEKWGFFSVRRVNEFYMALVTDAPSLLAMNLGNLAARMEWRLARNVAQHFNFEKTSLYGIVTYEGEDKPQLESALTKFQHKRSYLPDTNQVTADMHATWSQWLRPYLKDIQEQQKMASKPPRQRVNKQPVILPVFEKPCKGFNTTTIDAAFAAYTGDYFGVGIRNKEHRVFFDGPENMVKILIHTINKIRQADCYRSNAQYQVERLRRDISYVLEESHV